MHAKMILPPPGDSNHPRKPWYDLLVDLRSPRTGPDGASSFWVASARARPFSVREALVEKIAVLFPSADAEAKQTDPAWLAEIAACESTRLFYPVLYNESAFAEGAELRVSSPAPTKKAYCIRRGRLFRDKLYRRGKSTEMEHALGRFGYAEALRFTDGHSWEFAFGYPPDEYDIRDSAPESIGPHHRYWRVYSEEYGWFPDLHVLRSLLPAVAKNDGGTFCHADGSPVVIEELTTWGAAERIIRHMSDRPLEEFNGTYLHAPMWFQRYVEIALAADGMPVEWRVFFLEGRVVSAMPKFVADIAAQPPAPPEEALARFRESRCFRAVDYALDVEGRWWVLKSQAGEQAAVPAGGSAEEFYRRLEEEILRGPDLPEWVWCLTARVVKGHALGEGKARVGGSRHFAPGARVVFADAFWGQGAERCTVLGAPKYSDSLVGVVVRSELLEDFRCERTTDKSVIRALATNRLDEPFERKRETNLRGYYELWGQSEDVRKHIEERAEDFNAWLESVKSQRGEAH